jgi:hypothetical protein
MYILFYGQCGDQFREKGILQWQNKRIRVQEKLSFSGENKSDPNLPGYLEEVEFG